MDGSGVVECGMQTSRIFPELAASPSTATFPATRYQGSKAKLIDWILDNLSGIEFETCLDAFGGTGTVAYHLKKAGKTVAYNDHLQFNHRFAYALIENRDVMLDQDTIDFVLERHSHIDYPTFVEDNFHDIYFTDDENRWIDQAITNIEHIEDQRKAALAFFALAQSCIVKRPYNLFHRKNLYIRFAEVERSFGNKVSWDKPFPDWFRSFAEEANKAVFCNGKNNVSLNCDALAVPGEFDLVYIDTPYLNRNGTGVDYRDFYHFLEGLTMYRSWADLIDRKSKHRRLRPQRSDWSDKRTTHAAFDRLFQRYENSKIVVSYRSDGVPSEGELVDLLGKYKRSVVVHRMSGYKYALSRNNESTEILIIGTD